MTQRLFPIVLIIASLMPRLTQPDVGQAEYGAHEMVQSISGGGTCSSICLAHEGFPIFGANMDFAHFEDGQVFINKRNMEKVGLIPGQSGVPAIWTSRYASLTFALVGYGLTWAGMNEEGLTFSTMGAYGFTQQPSADQRPPLDSGEWIQYMLDNCATLDEVVAEGANVRIYTVDHYLVADRHGNCGVVEFLNGQMVVYTGDDLPIWALTNIPYRDALLAWDWYQQHGTHPSNESSTRRFLTAAERLSNFSSENDEEAVEYAFDTLHAIRGELYSEHISQ